MNRLRPNDQRARNAIIFLWVILTVNVISIFSSYLQYNLLNNIQTGNFTMAEAESNDLREAIVAILMFGAYLGCIITFIQWFRRGYYNLHQKHDTLLFTEGWAAGAWFVPFMNLGRPARIMNEMMTETESLLVKAELTEEKSSRKVLVTVWWIFWLVYNISQNIVSRISMKTTDAGLLADLTMADIVLSILFIPMTIITIKMIKEYAAMEALLPEVSENAPKEFTVEAGDLLDSTI